MDIITRKQARSAATPLKRYFTGEPCKHGHVCERMTSDKSCLMCHSLKTRAQHIGRRDEYNAMRRTSLSRNRDEQAATNRAWRTEKRNDEPVST